MAIDILRTLQQAGFKGEALRTAWAIAKRESGFDPAAFNPDTSTGDRSWGLFQINTLGPLQARVKQYGLKSERDLLDPATNARVAYQLSKGGTDWGHWGVGKNAYRQTAPLDYSGFPAQGRRQNNPTAGATVPQAGVSAAPPPRAPQVTVKQLNQLARQYGFGSFRQAFGFDDDGQIAALLKQRAPVPTVRKLAGGTIPVYNNTGRPGLPKAASKVLDLADDYLGTPYSFGGGNAQGPSQGRTGVGFDCSGFSKFLYAKVGIELPHLAAAQFRMGQRITDPRALQEGDLVFFRSSGSDAEPGHMGIAVGNGMFIHAPQTGDVVKISRLSDRHDFVGGSRFF